MLVRAPIRNCDTLLGSHADVHRIADRRPERRMHPGEQDKVTDFDLKIQAVAEEGLGQHRPGVEIVAIGGLLRLFRQLDILGPVVAHDLRVPEITTPLVTEEDVQRFGLQERAGSAVVEQ